MYFNENVVATVKKMGRSPIFILATIAVTLSALLSLWSAIECVINYINGAYYDDGYMFLGDLLVYLIGFVLVMLVALGMILFLSSCISKKTPVSTGGLTIIKIIQVIQLVFSTIGFVLLFLVALLALIIPNTIGMEEVSNYLEQYAYFDINNFTLFGGTTFAAVYNVILIFVLIFTIIAGILVFLYYMKTLRTIKSVRLALTTGQPNNKGSVYIFVMNFILAAVTLLGILSDVISFLKGDLLLNSFIFTTAANFFSLVALLSIAIAIIMYRGKMNDLMSQGDNVYVQPTQTYSHPPVTPVEPSAPVTPVTPSNSDFCTKCGNKLIPGSAFCTSCGQKVD